MIGKLFSSLKFLFQLIVMMGVRKVLDLFFSSTELKILDDILPEFKRHEQLDIEEENVEV